MKILLFTILLSACMHAGFTQNAMPPNSQNLESIKVPDFSDPEIKVFFVAYHANLGNYLKAVRQNNKSAIKTFFDKDVSNFEKITKIMEKARSIPAEHKKALTYLTQTKPYIKEISQHPYVKELSKEYLKNYEKK